MIPSVAEIDTDTSSRKCSFKVNLDEVDIAAKLNEIADGGNRHVKGWSVWSEG
jgi:hypothetical protein